MPTPSQSLWNNCCKVTAYLLDCLENVQDAAPWLPRETDTPEDSVRRYRLARDFNKKLDEALEYTFADAGLLADALIDAHRAAGLIQVKTPTDNVAKTLAEDLEGISKAVSEDQKFKAVADVAGAIAKALNS